MRILKPLKPVPGGSERATQVLRLHGGEEDLTSVAGGHKAEALVVETDVLSFRTGLLGRRVTGLEATVSGMRNTYPTLRYRGHSLWKEKQPPLERATDFSQQMGIKAIFVNSSTAVRCHDGYACKLWSLIVYIQPQLLYLPPL